jgi:type IV pilus assembly protein PilE
MQMKFEKGFTLIELMITVVILAILVSVGIPMYTSYVARGKLVEAANNLSSWRVQMEQYYQDNRTYMNGANCGVTPPTGKYFTYSCPAGSLTATAYVLQADGGLGADTSMSGFQYQVNQQNAKVTNLTGAAVAKGWGIIGPPAVNTFNCWVTNKGGKC